MFIEFFWHDPAFYISWVVIVVFSICMHEFSHAWVALHEGDDTALRSGKLSVNPLDVMGVYSLVALALFGIAWGAVPVNRHRMRKASSPALVSFAGPLANIVLALIFSALLAVVGNAAPGSLFAAFKMMFRAGAIANCVLFIFNMLPIPMLDGWEVLSFFLAPMRRLTVQQRNSLTLVVFILLMAGGFSVIWQMGSNLAAVMVLFFDGLLPTLAS